VEFKLPKGTSRTEIEEVSARTSSASRTLLLALFLPVALAIGHALSTSIPGLSNTTNRIGQKENSGSEPTIRADLVSRSWYSGAGEYVTAMDAHRSMQTPLLVYFYTGWCPYCKKLDQEILPTEEVAQFMRSVNKVRINPEAGPDERALADQFGVRGYPSVFIIPVNSDAPIKIYPFKKVGETFVAVTPSEFITECEQASKAY
jgi:thiol-disulfide isomerase/thioredoxin